MSERADAVFPVATFAESEGTFVNVEGRVQRFHRIIEPLGESRPDWWIVSQLSLRLGKRDFSYKKSSEIWRDLKKTIPAFSKARASSRKRGKTPFIHESGPKKEKMIQLKYQSTAELTSKTYPFLLCSEYNLDYYRSLALSKEVKGINAIRNPLWFKVNPLDAKRLHFKEGDKVDISSAVKKVSGIIKIADSVPQGVVRSSLLWIEEPGLSTLLPVKMKRGK
jgi:predicted molibdopterin-dependent oxidoreductase YjgC